MNSSSIKDQAVSILRTSHPELAAQLDRLVVVYPEIDPEWRGDLRRHLTYSEYCNLGAKCLEKHWPGQDRVLIPKGTYAFWKKGEGVWHERCGEAIGLGKEAR